MSVDEIVQIIHAIFPGKDPGAVGQNPGLLLLVFSFALLAICTALVKNRRYAGATIAFALAVLLSTGFYLIHANNGDGGKPNADNPAAGFTLHTAKVLIGGDLASSFPHLEKITLLECQRRCKAESRCVAFTYDQVQGACYMKQAVTSMHDFATATTGVKR